ncbi:MAG: hypothetical protein E7271_10750 [Lachnospiraceae bacterium]|nr:hypothetical protein [Lachnospiraceae bacterium]
MKREVPKKTRNIRDKGVIGRRVEMMYWLSIVRITNYKEIQNEFGITPQSVKVDLDSLENDFEVPLIRNRKGIRVADGWYAQRPHFKSDENKLLYELLDVVPEEYIKPVEKLIRAYGNPSGLRK